MSATTKDDAAGWPEMQRQRRAIVVVDVVESVRLMQAHEADVIHRWRRFVNEVRTQVLPEHGGRLVKSLGDGLMLEFQTVPPAIAAALDMQRRIVPYNAGCDASAAMNLRIGAHVAEVVVDQLDVFGTGVNLAARLASLAEPGDVVVSAAFRDEATDGLDAAFEDLGECNLKHMSTPVRAFRVGAVEPVRTWVPATGNTSYRPVIAVLPFRLRCAGDPSGLLGDVLADEMIARLSRSPQLQVISRLSCAAFKHSDLSLPAVAHLLGAAYVVSGSGVELGGRLRLQCELADGHDGHVLWADGTSASLGEAVGSEEGFAANWAEQICRTIVNTEIARSGRRALASQSSYTLLMAAVSLMHRNAKLDFDRARTMLDHLIERDPYEPLPRAWLGKWFGIRAAQGWSPNMAADAREALTHVERALTVDPANSLAWTIKGLIHGYISKDLNLAQQAYQTALRENPSESLAWLYSATLNAWRERHDEATDAASTAQRLSPLDPLKYYYDSLAATTFLIAGDLPAALQLAQRSLRLNRTHSSTHRTLAIAQVLSGQVAEARNTVSELLRIQPQLTVSSFRERYPGRDAPHAEVFCRALAEAGLPD